MHPKRAASTLGRLLQDVTAGMTLPASVADLHVQSETKTQPPRWKVRCKNSKDEHAEPTGGATLKA